MVVLEDSVRVGLVGEVVVEEAADREVAFQAVIAQEVVAREVVDLEVAVREDDPGILGEAAYVIRAGALVVAGVLVVSGVRESREEPEFLNPERAEEEPERQSAEEATGQETGRPIISAADKQVARILPRECRALARRTSEIWWVK